MSDNETKIELIGVSPGGRSLDLSQAHSLFPGSIETEQGPYLYNGVPGKSAAAELREALIEVVERMKQATLQTFSDHSQKTESRIQELVQNLNPVLNELDRRLVQIETDQSSLREVVAAFLRLFLAGEKMAETDFTEIQAVLTRFLHSTSTFTVAPPDAEIESTVKNTDANQEIKEIQ